jgi:hypothetical protein
MAVMTLAPLALAVVGPTHADQFRLLDDAGAVARPCPSHVPQEQDRPPRSELCGTTCVFNQPPLVLASPLASTGTESLTGGEPGLHRYRLRPPGVQAAVPATPA